MDDEKHDEFVNAILDFTPDEWDEDAGAEEIAIKYVRYLESEVTRLGGKLYPYHKEES